MLVGKNMNEFELIEYINTYIASYLKKKNLNTHLWLGEINVKNYEGCVWIRLYWSQEKGSIGYRIDELDNFYNYFDKKIPLETLLKSFLNHEIGHFLDGKMEKEHIFYTEKRRAIHTFLYKEGKGIDIDKIFLDYKQTLLKNERRAWRIAETLLEEEKEKKQFLEIKKASLATYKDMLKGLEQSIKMRKNFI